MLRVYPSTLHGAVNPPPSKSYTHRAIALATIAEESSKIVNPLISGDTIASINASKLLGCTVEEEDDTLLITPPDSLECPSDVIDVKNSGTTLRFYTSITSLVREGYSILTGDESIRRRPMAPLLNALKKLGVDAWSSRMNGLAPVIVKGGGIRGGETEIKGSISSQFISSLIISGQKADDEIIINITDEPVSRTYIDATIETVKLFGGKVEKTEDYGRYWIKPSDIRGRVFKIPADFSSASFLVAGAYLTGGEVRLTNVNTDLPQADATIIDIAEKMGAKVMKIGEDIVVKGESRARGITISLRDSPDLVPVVAVMAALTSDETTIYDIAHARLKESDRITNVARELKKLGVETEHGEDYLIIKGREKIEGGKTIETYGDHRIAMAFTILGLACERGLTIREIESARISYPSFTQHLENLGAKIKTY